MDRRFGITLARAIILLVGILSAAFGLLLLVAEPSFPISGLLLIGFGVVFIVAALLERMRYRSAAADTIAAPVGPGGGEPIDQPMEARFQRTDERFVDPTTSVPMRVWIDPTTGERRYRAEG
jgi:hypothetical protein